MKKNHGRAELKKTMGEVESGVVNSIDQLDPQGCALFANVDDVRIAVGVRNGMTAREKSKTARLERHSTGRSPFSCSPPLFFSLSLTFFFLFFLQKKLKIKNF